MVERFNIQPPGTYNRKVRGRHVYTPVVVVRGADHAHVYVAGKTSMLPQGSVGCVGDLRGQMALVCAAIRDSLAYVGAALNDVVRTVTYVRDIDAYYEVSDERYKYFSDSLPTNTLIAVSRLAHPDMLIEIEAEAIVAPSRLKNLSNPQ